MFEPASEQTTRAKEFFIISLGYLVALNAVTSWASHISYLYLGLS